MRSVNHATRLQCFAPGKMTPYMLLESLDHLRQRGLLGPLWLALEQQVEREFRASDANRGWAWKLEDNQRVFDAWNFNIRSPTTAAGQREMMPQLELAEEALEKIVEALAPPSEAMIKEMTDATATVQTQMCAHLNALMDEFV